MSVLSQSVVYCLAVACAVSLRCSFAPGWQVGHPQGDVLTSIMCGVDCHKQVLHFLGEGGERAEKKKSCKALGRSVSLAFLPFSTLQGPGLPSRLPAVPEGAPEAVEPFFAPCTLPCCAPNVERHSWGCSTNPQGGGGLRVRPTSLHRRKHTATSSGNVGRAGPPWAARENDRQVRALLGNGDGWSCSPPWGGASGAAAGWPGRGKGGRVVEGGELGLADLPLCHAPG